MHITTLTKLNMVAIFNFTIFMVNGRESWQKMKINQNVVQPIQKIQKRKRAFFKKYGASFLDAIVIRL